MKKGKTARIVLAIVLALALSLALAACGTGASTTTPASTPASTPANTGAAPATDTTCWPKPVVNATPSVDTKYTLAFNNWGTGAETFDWHQNEIVYIVQNLLGMTINCASDETIADNILKNVQNFCASGVDGIIMSSSEASVLPQCADAAKQAQIPFTLTIWAGTPDQRADLIANNSYFHGSADADTYTEAYMLGKQAIADGNKTSVLIGANIGDATNDTRVAGWTQAFVTEGGGKVLDIARCANPSESQEKGNALLSANRTADCMYVLVGDFFPGAYNAMQTLGISPSDMTVYCSLCGTQTSQYIKDGIIKDATGGHDLAAHLSTCMLINALDGHPILDDTGKPPQFEVEPFLVDASNADQFMSLFFTMTDGQHVLTDDFLKSLLWRYNPNVSYADYKYFCDNLSLDLIASIHGQ